MAIGTAALIGWVVAKTAALPFIIGLDSAEPVQLADGLCAALAAVTALFALSALGVSHRGRPQVDRQRRIEWMRRHRCRGLDDLGAMRMMVVHRRHCPGTRGEKQSAGDGADQYPRGS